VGIVGQLTGKYLRPTGYGFRALIFGQIATITTSLIALVVVVQKVMRMRALVSSCEDFVVYDKWDEST